MTTPTVAVSTIRPTRDHPSRFTRCTLGWLVVMVASRGLHSRHGAEPTPWGWSGVAEEEVVEVMAFLPLFGEPFQQAGTCLFANEQFSIALVAEGTHKVKAV